MPNNTREMLAQPIVVSPGRGLDRRLGRARSRSQRNQDHTGLDLQQNGGFSFTAREHTRLHPLPTASAPRGPYTAAAVEEGGLAPARTRARRRPPTPPHPFSGGICAPN
ncbi:hypothetical protein ElyMa_004761800 [Elysia marginata]|uniref:Uncharacterized protein n=1 Tax=Elysia marginata TaxID=1093978 RepID=A0AAV4IHQ2_9GAST|nr:hypothetical protein ElyMa_004761800 [Elysia marginata]